MGDIEKIKKAVKKLQETDYQVRPEDWLSSSSTLFNMAASGRPEGAFAVGKFFWMVGASSAGKTSLSLATLAEACINPRFKEYDLIFNNGEQGALMNIRKFYGERLYKRLKPPEIRDGEPHNSETLDEWYFHMDTRLSLVESGKAPPFIELLDSMDNLGSNKEREQFKKRKAAAAKPTAKQPGDYGDGKAGLNSRYLREIIARLHKTGSILIVLSQERDNVGGDLFDPKSVAAGGRALKFYATWQSWQTVGASLTREVHGIKRKIGSLSHVAIKKNRLTGKEWAIDIPMYYSYGLDDIGSMVDFLAKEKYFETKDKGSTLIVPEFAFVGSKDELAVKVDQNNLKSDLTMMVVEAWREIEKACVLERKPRYE